MQWNNEFRILNRFLSTIKICRIEKLERFNPKLFNLWNSRNWLYKSTVILNLKKKPDRQDV